MQRCTGTSNRGHTRGVNDEISATLSPSKKKMRVHGRFVTEPQRVHKLAVLPTVNASLPKKMPVTKGLKSS